MKKLEAIIAEKFSPKDGPFFNSLTSALDNLNVCRQAYQGGTFVGNHVHKLLQVRYNKLLHTIIYV